MIDIYFEENYGRLYEKIENGELSTFEYKSYLGHIKNIFIKRKINITLDDKKTYYDIITPYGYGGPIIIDSKYDKNDLIKEYIRKFSDYCIEENIVSEFIRFHPLLRNAEYFKDHMFVEDIRTTVVTNLNFDDPIKSEFSKSCRKNILNSLKNGISYEILEKPKDIKEFIDIYYNTMDRNNAKDYYYFDEEYFKNISLKFKNNIVCVKVFFNEVLIAMNLCFAYGDYIHIHLSGVLKEYLSKRPAYILRYAICDWGYKNGYSYVHHGGGRTNDINDKLLEFKKQFGVNTQFTFSVAKNIWNKPIYDELTKMHFNMFNIEDKDDEYFPKYRA